MKKSCVENVIIHVPEKRNAAVLTDKINEFHVGVIERRLNGSNLSMDEKIAVIDQLIDRLKSREQKGLIK